MLLDSAQVASLLKALGLTQSVFKPIPDLVGGLTAPLDGILSGVDGLTGELLGDLPLLGGLLISEKSTAVDPSVSPNGKAATKDAQTMGATGSCAAPSYDPPEVLSQTFPPFDQAKANVFRYRQQQSVNMGSWFVHEQWMTPSLFTCASGPQIAEIDIASGWGNTTAARAVLEQHWDTFINQSDFEYLSAIGINTVRLPIGYWSLGPIYCQGTPFESVADVYTNSWSRVVRAINWAGEAGIGVLVDLHGAPGSQNGQPHSGISDGQVNFFNNATNMDKTVEVLTYLTQQLASVTNVIGIEILNEPNDDASLPDFYTRAMTTMRQVSPEAANFPLYIHDGFNLNQYSDFVADRQDFVVEDHHSYFVFDASDTSRSASQDTKEVDGDVSGQLLSASQKQRRNLVVGEWSCALVPDSLTNEKNQSLARQKFCQGQEQVYSNTTAGWHFWSYMKEGCDTDLDWCFKNAVGRTLPNSFHSYGSAPATSPIEMMSFSRAISNMELPSMSEVLSLASNESAAPATPAGDPTSSLTEASSMSTDTMDCITASASPEPSEDLSRRSRLGAHQHRFSAVHSRRSFFSDISKHRRDNASTTISSTSAAALTATELSITKGYSDGFMTAKIFAQYGMSKLGFTGQYVADSMKMLGDDKVAPDTEGYYTAWFNRGLTDAEGIIRASANP